jgi:hypothetical protein
VVEQDGPFGGGMRRRQIERVDAVRRRRCDPQELAIHRLAQRPVFVLAIDDDHVGIVVEQHVAAAQHFYEEGLAAARRRKDAQVGVLTDFVVEQVQLDQAMRLLVDSEQHAARHARRGGHERVNRRKRARIQREQDLERIATLRQTRAMPVLLPQTQHQGDASLRRKQPRHFARHRIQFRSRVRAQLKVQTDREQGALAARESSPERLHLLERGDEVVVDRPAAFGVLVQRSVQPPAL